MGILQDTIRDAHRPIDGIPVRRAATDDVEVSLPDDDSAADGMQTIFRFQKDGAGRPQEASSQSAREVNSLQTGDPLLAGIEAERSTSSAINNIGAFWVDVTDRTKIREGSLETGQEEHGSPSKIEAVDAKFASEKVQSLRVPVPVEARLHREKHKPKVRDGSEQPVSGSEEEVWSEPTGRGAPPSETYLTKHLAETFQPGDTAPTLAGNAVATPAAPLESAIYTAEHADQRAMPGVPAKTPTRTPPNRSQPVVPILLGEQERNGRHAVANHFHVPGERSSLLADTQLRTAPPATAAEPSLVIGRIDVVVVAPQPQTQPALHADSNRGFLSRNYLKRL